MAADDRTPRRLNLYGRRKGKALRAGRKALVEAALPRLRAVAGDAACPQALFPEPRRALWLEVGFGAGEHLAEQAAAHPDVGIFGAEPYAAGVARLVAYVAERGLGNVRIVDGDVRPFLQALPDACLERVFLLFPDPWPKARHAKRRFVNPDNIAQVARTLADHGEWRIATDDAGYCRWTLALLSDHPQFEWQAESPADWRERPPDWPRTRYEAKALAAGRACVYLRFRRRARGGQAD